ncbi:ATP-binding cassette domain-containing protein [Nonomuraea sp. MCN248]|uniref:ATP-binding cassette domain-containing protein n=1 Tax=Nonomuraea corallina TaxID=2989783 RepID=A0ABT4S4S2_9ACTN|nr:ATP-binding cassette domain-containing protein [Nonomuraea corallina]MDA0632189.1 ATP-binding cassette domain-containing protein [Nonomuraea corallina]
MTGAVTLEHVTKIHGGTVALDDVSATVPAGRFTAVLGPAGSGKSTLLHCASGLDLPTSGDVTVAGVHVTALGESERDQWRRAHVGLVFPSHNLLPSLTIEQNLTLPLRLALVRPDRSWLRELAGRAGLADRLHDRPAELPEDGQRLAAVVRAFAARPAVVFADEPAGPSGRVLDLLRELVEDLGQTVVMTTRDRAAAARAHDVLLMERGRVVDPLSAPGAGIPAHERHRWG